MSPETEALLPWFIALMTSFVIAGIYIAHRDLRSHHKAKTTVGRHARPSAINDTASVQQNT